MPKVEIYTREFCPYCVRAIQLLDRKGVSYSHIDAGMDVDKKREMVRRANGGSTFPQIFINDIHIGGCDDLYAMERAGKLDGLLALE